MHSSLHALPVLQDNVIWLWVRGRNAAVVDPAVAAPVQDWLEQHQLQLQTVLQTHHHADHIGGTPELLERWPGATVVAAGADRERIPFQTVSVGDGDRITVLDQPVDVLDVAAHTRAHIAFYVPVDPAEEQRPMLFCGDTLFAGGCGRLFEGSPAQMHRAMQRLATLPETTQVCCAHEYTEANLAWSVEQRPEDQAITERYRTVQAMRSRGELTLPSSIGIERRTNLFMRAETAEDLAVLRSHKDHWRRP